MKLEKYEDKSKKKRKALLISLGVIVLVSISFLLYKTFAVFNEHVEFPMMNGKVDYFGNSDVYFAFYKKGEPTNTMPEKGNSEKLVFDHAKCDNGAEVEWDENEWAPLIKKLTKNKTKCSLYFDEKVIRLDKDITIVENGDGLYKVSHDVSEISTDWNKTEYRYAGKDPDNYVLFNNEKWRIIGLVNVKTENGVEQRLKIVRPIIKNDQLNVSIGSYAWDNNNTNNWTTSTLKDMLNGIYYESGSGDCYKSGNVTQCDFSTGEEIPKGLNNTARNMIDKDVIWTLGGHNSSEEVTDVFYEKERGNSTLNTPTEWSKETDKTKFNGVGVLYPSDFGYAIGGDSRSKCLTTTFYDFSSSCYGNVWIISSFSDNFWTITPDSGANKVFDIEGYMYSHIVTAFKIVYPTVYLKPEAKIIDGKGTTTEPFILKEV